MKKYGKLMDLKLLDLVKTDSCVAIIPARGGSKSIPGKNIRLIKGHPMIAYSIAAAKLAENIDRVLVSTDSEEIAEIAKQYGAEVPFLRPSEYAQDHSPDIDFVKHAIDWLAKNEKSIPEYWIHLRPTTPLRNPDIIDHAIVQMKADHEATSLRSGSICVHPPYKWFQKKGKYLVPLSPGLTCDEVNLPRQEFPEVYIPNGYVDIIKSKFVIQSDLLHGDKMIGFKTNEVPDIDTEEDMKKLLLLEEHDETIDRLFQYFKNVLGGCG